MAYDYERKAYSPNEVQITSRGNVWFFRLGGAELAAHVNGPDLAIISVEAPVEMRGQGVGKALYRALFQQAEKMGKGVVSDATVEEPAARVWESLKREGYPIVKHPKAKPVKGEDPGWFVADGTLSQPVFRLRRSCLRGAIG